MRGLSLSSLAAGVLTLLLAAAPLRAAEEVDLTLALMVDASGSVDSREYQLQRVGYIQAFRDPRVIDAVRSGYFRKVAVTMVEWTGPALQASIAEWTVLSDAESVEAFAKRLETEPRFLYGGGTSVGAAILFGAQVTDESGYKALRRVIDVSGDGSNNRGISAALARDRVVAQGFVVNGLPILTDEPHLDRYYESEVIGGPGAFVIAAKSFEDFARAIRAKLIREIAGRPTQDIDERDMETAER